MYDLHIHSYYSDGENSVDEIIDIAKSKKLKAISVVDHNYIYPSVKALTDSLKVVPGIEISAIDDFDGSSVHILGYFNTEVDYSGLNNKLSSTIDGYNERAKKIIAKLNLKYPTLGFSFRKLTRNTNEAFLSRNTLARELQKCVKDLSFESALAECFIHEDDAWMMRASEAIKLIKNFGGIAVWAHPAKYLDNHFEERLSAMIDFGISGIESYYSKYNSLQVESLLNYAQRYGLLVTGGSDWHGKDYSFGVQLGCKLSEREYSEFIKALKR